MNIRFYTSLRSVQIIAFHIILLFSINALAMNDTIFNMEDVYLKVKDHKDLVGVIPDEMGTSFPVPVLVQENDNTVIQMAFFHFYMRMTKPTEPREFRISSPRQKTIVSFPELGIIETKHANSSFFGIDWDDSKPVGKYISDPEVPYEKKLERRARFFELYNLVMPLYIAKSSSLDDSDKQSIKEFKDLFNEIGHPPLIPYYKSLNPEFFKWIDENEQ
jgi:hypothetical protein